MSKNNFEVNLGLLDNLFEIKYDFRNFYYTLITGKNSQTKDGYGVKLFKTIDSLKEGLVENYKGDVH